MATVSSVEDLTPIMPSNPDWGINTVQEKVDEIIALIKSGEMGGSTEVLDSLEPIMPGNPDWGMNTLQKKVDEIVWLIRNGEIGGGGGGDIPAPSDPTMPDDYQYGRNASYDLTGRDSKFRSQNQIVVFTSHQVHTFKTPVHLGDDANPSGPKGIIVRKWTNGEWTTVKKATSSSETNCWRVNELAVDTMSTMYRMDNSFTGQIVKSIEIDLSDVVAPGSDGRVIVSITAQDAFKSLYEIHGFNGVGPSYTPALGRYLLERLEEISAIVTSNIANSFSITDTVNDMLPEDLTGVSPKNYVEFEIHDSLKTTSGVDTIMPARGACYDHDFQMWRFDIRTGSVQMSNKQYNLENRAIFIYKDTTNVGNTTSKVVTEKRVYLTNENYDQYIGMIGSFIDRARIVPMVRGVDYDLVNLNVAKTEMSSSEYGVYDSVRLLKSFVGNVLISYHSFGGEVVFSDVQDLRKDIINVIKILTSKKLLTADVVEHHPVIKDLFNRLQVMEQFHDHFNRVEHSVHMHNPGFHWFNIATLYDVQWENPYPVTDEIGTFRVESLALRWCYEFTLGIDLRKKLADMLRCKTLMTTDVHTSDLSDYLRANMSFMDSEEPIPFEQEMDHVRAYLALEKLRFPEELNYSIVTPVTDFSLPALTVQPLVENAVRHGIVPTGREGILVISTRENTENYFITISDNGRGFDKEGENEEDRKHIGIQNVRERLRRQVGAELIINSTLGEGTEVTIKIPKNN